MADALGVARRERARLREAAARDRSERREWLCRDDLAVENTAQAEAEHYASDTYHNCIHAGTSQKFARAEAQRVQAARRAHADDEADWFGGAL